jgi:hypothetical protein
MFFLFVCSPLKIESIELGGLKLLERLKQDELGRLKLL